MDDPAEPLPPEPPAGRRRHAAEQGSTAGSSPSTPRPPEAPPTRGDRLDHLLEREAARHQGAGGNLVRRLIRDWKHWPVSVAVAAAIALQATVPDRLAIHPHVLLLLLEGLLLVVVTVFDLGGTERGSGRLRVVGMTLTGIISLANAWSAGHLIRGLVQGTEGQNAGPLLTTGAAIWLTNVIVFSLWYWEFDRGGPARRLEDDPPHPDFLFPQMATPECTHEDWQPTFVDYFYLSFTNASAFSPTDVMPLTPRAKLTMLLQSAVSLATVALVIARAVNILK